MVNVSTTKIVNAVMRELSSRDIEIDEEVSADLRKSLKAKLGTILDESSAVEIGARTRKTQTVTKGKRLT